MKKLLLCLLPAAAALAANTQISTEKPIVNFRLPLFNSEGYRTLMVRGSEAAYESSQKIVIKALTLTVFSGTADEKIDTLILSPNAVVNRTESLVTGPSTIRVIRGDEFEASGTNWSYHDEGLRVAGAKQAGPKNFKVSMAKNVRVSFKAEFKDFLK